MRMRSASFLPSKLGLAQPPPDHPLHPPHHTYLPRPQPQPHHGPLNLLHEFPQPEDPGLLQQLHVHVGVVEPKQGAQSHSAV